MLNLLKKLLSLLLSLVIFGCTAANVEPKSEETVNLMVASDLHYLAQDLYDESSLFTDMIQNSDGKNMLYAGEALQSLIDEALKLQPDALVLSGDLSFNGELESHQQLAQALSVLPAAGIPVYVLPGNHDLNNPLAFSYLEEIRSSVPSVSQEEFAEIYSPYGLDQAIARDPSSLSYIVPLSDSLWLAMIDVNDPLLPGGVLPETLDWLQQQLESAWKQDIEVISVSHQNLLQHNLLLVEGYVMENHADLLRMLESYGVPVHLSGHMHINHTETSPQGLVEIASSSLVVSPMQYGWLSISKNAVDYETRLLNVSQEAKEAAFALMEEDYYQKALTETGGNEELARYFARMHSGYFAGSLKPSMNEAGLNRAWKEYPGFTQIYLESITSDPSSFSNNNRIHIDLD